MPIVGETPLRRWRCNYILHEFSSTYTIHKYSGLVSPGTVLKRTLKQIIKKTNLLCTMLLNFRVITVHHSATEHMEVKISINCNNN